MFDRKSYMKKYRKKNCQYFKDYSECWRKSNPNYMKNYRRDNREELEEKRLKKIVEEVLKK